MKNTSTSTKQAVIDFPVEEIRRDFPILSTSVHGKPLVYLDNAASTQKPHVVIDTIKRYYCSENSNVHRGVHYLSELATKKYEAARVSVRKFLNAESEREIIFVRGATEAINLVAATFGRQNVHPGDEVLITELEHHSNIVPWQMLCEEQGAKLRIAPIDDNGEVVLEEFAHLLSGKTKIAAISHVSNALGTVNPVKQMIEMAHQHGVPVLVDGAQAVQHMRIDVRDLDADFYAFSSHKIFGPTGLGILFGKAHLLESMPPYQGGGDMIKSVTFEKTIFTDIPHKYEAGTPHIAGAIGLAAAIDYMNLFDWNVVQQYEQTLLRSAQERLTAIQGLRIIGTAKEKAGVVSFVMEGIHPHDIGTILDQEGIAIRTGHHCAQPVMQKYGIPATARASFTFYNTEEEISTLIRGIQKVKEVFGHV
ncbi:MAG: cysteine desulfurase [Ignavibacteriales bacterium]|nr:cysteine desulfurase [Ignavibacteriales bacterium]